MAWMRKKGSAAQPPESPAAAATAGPEPVTEAPAPGKAPAPEPAEPAAAAPEEGSAPLLFYSQPVVLSASQHTHWRYIAGSLAFAGNTASIPLVASDFAAASRSYPILFAAGEAAPVALVGLERTNLFVEGSAWAEDAYVPAYVRRHPFVMVESRDRTSAALAVDAASELISQEPGTEGAALFDGTQPSAVTLRALEFCRLFSQDHARTRAFSRALLDEGLTIERRAAVTLASGRQLAVGGFHVVDPQKFAQLSEEKVVTWHRNGWLGLVHFHLASLERFADLVRRQNLRDTAAR